MKRIAILASGEGTNAENIIRYFSERKTAKVVVVITNKAQAGVLNRADKLGIPTEFIPAPLSNRFYRLGRFPAKSTR